MQTQDQVAQDRQVSARQLASTLAAAPQSFAIKNARKIDAQGIIDHFWVVVAGDAIQACGTNDGEFEAACKAAGISAAADGAGSGDGDLAGRGGEIIDAAGKILTPGYVDIHAHGAWGSSFDDGVDGIEMARAGHMQHGTTRQVLSLITNPLDVITKNLTTVCSLMGTRPDILGTHLEGPFLALERKGAHDPNCLLDPIPSVVDELLEAADGCLRQITIAPELPHGISAIRQFAAAGVVPAVGHCSADYETAKNGFDAGATIMTHMFNAMNSMHHRKPGPIPAAVQDPRVTIELINDGFHVQNPMLRMGFGFAPHRIAFITDAMAATECPDGHYLLGELDVNVVDGHARLVSNGAIAGSTLVLEKAVQRAVLTLGFSPVDAVEAATLTPARAFGFDRANAVTGAPLGLVSPGYAADILLSDASDWSVDNVWCAGRRVK
ncbi:MAG: N-acetylglucosamine-6-phosphate deacetylase [Bifidobacteriaceae bacterium]|jgi:N-acetylglucosamine-6-phosphate deacetylase|nr:N-acetylglucosamine-6-phosphate deacetylase [Bifidobacteriaceae bacterium]